MYDIFKKVGKDRLIYSDTDNVIFEGKIKELKGINLGKKLGEFKVEFEDEEFECWGRKSKRVRDLLRVSGISENDLKSFNRDTGEIVFKKMQGIRKKEVGAFLEERRNLKEQAEDFLAQERELDDILIFIDESILKDDTDNVFYFKENIQKAVKGGAGLKSKHL